jgi:uncharacterized membrane protein (UPF0127 family)
MENNRNNFNHLVILGSKTVIFYLLFLVFAFAIPAYKEAKTFFGNTIEKVYSTRIVVGEKSVAVEIADSDEKRVRGLSGKDYLDDNHGMFFIFEEPDYYSIWMKSMNFSIDIIWINEEKEIVYIEQNISPKTYPKSFIPTQKALYILEVNAGFVKKAGIKIGDQITVL